MNTPKIRFKGFKDDWEQRKLGDVAEFLDTMRKPLEGARRIPGPYPYYGASGIVDYVDGYLFNEELVLLSEDGANITDRNYPVCFLASGKYWVNNHAHVLRLKDGNENNFVCTSLERKDYKQYNSGMAMPKLNQEVCRRIPIGCPSFNEQKKIGDYFRDLDHLITLHQRKCDETKQLKKFMLQKMFPKNGEKNPEIRFEGFTDDWEQRKLSELTTMHARIGWQNLRTSEFLDSGDYMLITGTDFQEGVIDYSTCHYVEKERYDQDKNIQIKNGSILITKDGTLGKVAYVQGLMMPATLNAGVFNVTIKNENIMDGKYLFQYLKAPFLMDYVSKKATGGTIKHLNQSILVDFPVAMPKREEQVKISRYFTALDNLITLHQRKCEKLKELKKFMLQNMFV